MAVGIERHGSRVEYVPALDNDAPVPVYYAPPPQPAYYSPPVVVASQPAYYIRGEQIHLMLADDRDRTLASA